MMAEVVHQLGYNHFISSQPNWNNCFIEFSTSFIVASNYYYYYYYYYYIIIIIIIINFFWGGRDVSTKLSHRGENF